MIRRSDLVYAVAKNPDGTVDLTVFEEDCSCTVTLYPAWAKGLADLLTGRDQECCEEQSSDPDSVFYFSCELPDEGLPAVFSPCRSYDRRLPEYPSGNLSGEIPRLFMPSL